MTSISSKNHVWFKQWWHKDAMSWLNQQRIYQKVILQNTNNIISIVTSKFNKKLRCDEEFDNKGVEIW